MLLFGSILLKHGRHFDYWNRTLIMGMRVCYLECHEAGLCCYLVLHVRDLLRPLQLFYFRLWPTYWLSFLYLKREVLFRSYNPNAAVRNREVKSSILDSEARYSGSVLFFCNFPLSLRGTVEQDLTGRNGFLPHPFQFSSLPPTEFDYT
jgi:hypothetical protein